MMFSKLPQSKNFLRDSKLNCTTDGMWCGSQRIPISSAPVIKTANYCSFISKPFSPTTSPTSAYFIDPYASLPPERGEVVIGPECLPEKVFLPSSAPVLV